MKNQIIENLIAVAKDGIKNSYSPYSGFAVGASVLADSGNIYDGSNVENSSFGLTICAERNAIFHAVNNSERVIDILVIYTPTKEPVSPCGACRQVLNEFGTNQTRVISVCDGEEILDMLLDELLPKSFGKRYLKEK